MTTEPEIEAEAKRWFREVSGLEWATGDIPYVAGFCRAHARHVLEHRALAGSDLIAGRTAEDWRQNIPHTGCDNRDALEMVDLIVALQAERRRPGDETVVANIMHDAAAKSGQMISSNQSDFMARAIIDAYGPVPSPPQITDADVLRCARVMWQRTRERGQWHEISQLARDNWMEYARACLETFLSPLASVDPRIAIVAEQFDKMRRSGQWGANQFARDVLAALDGVKADG